MPIYKKKKKLYRVIFMHFFWVRFNLTATFTLTCLFPNFSCTDSDFVDPGCLKPVSSVQYLSLLGSWPLYQLSKSLSFILKKSDMFAHFPVNSATLSAWNNNRSVDLFVGEVTFVWNLSYQCFSLSIVFLQSLQFFIASLLLEFSNPESMTVNTSAITIVTLY